MSPSKIKIYSYQAKRSWFDSETYAFILTTRCSLALARYRHVSIATASSSLIIRTYIGNNADLTWDSVIFGLENRFAAQLQTSSNWITFTGRHQ